MLKSEHYKRSIPWFALEKVVVGELYGEEMRRRIHRFKFVHNHVDHVYFRELFTSMKREYSYEPDCIVYPPVSLRDRIFRGPNHAKLLVQYFWPGDTPVFCPFQKKVFSSHQSRRTKAERSSVREEYSLHPTFLERIKGKKILLIDDLITTGWTAHTLGSLLKKAGAKEVVGYFLTSEMVNWQ